jgi:hypothetical protein
MSQNRAFGAHRFQFFQLQLQLLDLASAPFALRSEDHPAQLADEQLQIFDLVIAGGQAFLKQGHQAWHSHTSRRFQRCNPSFEGVDTS